MNSTKLEFLSKQIRRALELFAETLTDESTMMEIADVYPPYAISKAYKTGDVFSYGVNKDNETQLYQVLQPHTSAADWKPDEAVSLYKAIGITPSGYPIWTQPIGASDAYQTGDIVMDEGELWISTIDNNVWKPGVYGWGKYVE